MLDLTDNFLAEKEKLKYSPVFLVELSSLGKFYATREPVFSGLWIAGEDLIAGSSILANSSLPNYETLLHRVDNGGVGQITYELDNEGFARTGNSAVQFLNQAFLNHELQDLLLENSSILIRLGFFGYNREDYTTIFRGIVDKHSATFEVLDLDLADDTLRQLAAVPPQVGTDFLPRAFQQGQAVPIILGEVSDFPVTQLIGASSTFLAFDITSASTYLHTTNPNAPYPPKGSLLLSSSVLTDTVTYTRVTRDTVDNVTYNRFDLDVHTVNNHDSGATVELTDFKNRYLLGFSAKHVRKIRAAGGIPTSAPEIRNRPLDPLGADPRKITVLEFNNVETDVTATLAGQSRGEDLFITAPNTLTFGDGGWDFEIPAGRFEEVLKGTINLTQPGNSDAHWDVDIPIGKVYHVSLTVENIDALFVAVTMGTPASPSVYFSFSEVVAGGEQTFELDFISLSATFRLGLIIGNADGGATEQTVYFGNFDLYDTTTENPAHQFQHVIETHMPNITPHVASFTEAEMLWRDAGDRLAGVIQQTEEQQAMLGRIAQQFRAKTFLNEQGEQKLIVFDQSRIPVYDVTTRHIHKGSMTVTKSPLSEIYTSYYVYYGRSPDASNANDLGGRAAFNGVVLCTPNETNHSTEAGLALLALAAKTKYRIDRTLEVFADLIFDAHTAENLLSFLVKNGTHQRTTCTFTSYLNALPIEIGDFVRLSHPLLPASSQFGHFEILGKSLEPNGCFTHFVAQEINPFLYGGYAEHWEPPRRGFPARIWLEHWETPGPFTIGQKFDEHWENFLIDANDGFERWHAARITHNVKTLGQFYAAHYDYQTHIVYDFNGDTRGLILPGHLIRALIAETLGHTFTPPPPVGGDFSLAGAFPPLRTGVTVREEEAGGTGSAPNLGNDIAVVSAIILNSGNGTVSTTSVEYDGAVSFQNINVETVDLIAAPFTLDCFSLKRILLKGPNSNVDNRENFTIRMLVRNPILHTGYGANLSVPTAFSFGPILRASSGNNIIATVYMNGSTGKVEFANGTGSNLSTLSVTTVGDSFISLLDWHQIVISWNALTLEASITLDNKPRVTTTWPVPVYGVSNNIELGRFCPFDFPAITGHWFFGQIGEFTQWTRVLTDAEIEYMYVVGVGNTWPYGG